MKSRFFGKTVFSYAVLTIFFIACQKEPNHSLALDQNRTSSSARPQAIARSNDLVVKTFTTADRTYSFFYSPNGTVDSVLVTGSRSYAYRVTYKGSHLDSVYLVDNGRIVSTNSNFEYKGNLITSFDYFDRIDNLLYPWTYSLTYDSQRRIQSIERSYQNKVLNQVQISYDNNGNITTWNDFTSNSATYTYDIGLNPLHLIPDLFVIMVEEHWIWEYSLSQHNSISKTYFAGQSLTYQNQYNGSGQLVAKSFSNNSNNFSFTYQ
jgi:hypothetical protein